ncbi:MAG TPA: AI-2E family transporter [Candidatus Binatia bacterium]|nr:AI-2E family transporter [Candidatus Binatia bacterium]
MDERATPAEGETPAKRQGAAAPVGRLPGRSAAAQDMSSEVTDRPAATPSARERPAASASPPHRSIEVPRQAVLFLVFAGALGVVLYLARGALSPFVVGLLLVYLLDRPVAAMGRLGLPRIVAIPVVYGVVVLVLFEALSLTLTPLVEQAQSFGRELPGLLAALDEQLRRLGDVYRGLDIPADLRRAIDAALADLADALLRLDPSVLAPVFGSLASFVASLFGYLVIPVWVFYVLLDPRRLTDGIRLALPPAWREDATALGEIVRRVFGQWIRAQVLLGGIVGVATYVGLLALGAFVDPILARYALLLAIVAGVLELLPVIGPIISAVPAILVAATAGLEPMVAVLLLYLAVQQVENHLLVPKIQGDAVELHPGVVIFAIVVGAAVGGLLGAVLALPITATARNVYRYLFARLDDPPVGVDDALATVVGRRGMPTPAPADGPHGSREGG